MKRFHLMSRSRENHSICQIGVQLAKMVYEEAVIISCYRGVASNIKLAMPWAWSKVGMV